MMDPLVLRARYDPHWTEVEYGRAGGRDFLGIETLSEAILADLLPGINNQTRRARYYSFWAWVLRDFILDPDATHTQSGFYHWLRGRESALILANLAHDCGINAAGRRRGGDVWRDGQEEAYPLGWQSLESVSGGSYQLYYRGALTEMNVVQRSEDSPHDDLTKTVGLGLAEAYGQAVAGTQYVQYYLDATRLRRTDIEDFAEGGCLCHASIHPLERERLIDAFFRFDTPDIYAVKRLSSLCFFLDLIAQSEGQPLDQESFRAALYFWAYGDNHAYRPTGNLLAPAQRWRAFQLRQYYVYALECPWSLFLHRTQSDALSGEEYLGWLLDALDLAALAGAYGLSLPTTDPRSLTLQALHEAVRDALPETAVEPGPAALRTNLNEHALRQQIRASGSDLDVQSYLGHSALLLALIYWRCQPWRDEPAWAYASDRYGAGRLPVEGYLRDVDRAFEEQWSLARWLGWFHHRYLWLQHRRVVLEKLVSREQDTARFELLDARPGDAGEGTRGGPRFRGIHTDYPKINGPRFTSALEILLDLEVIESLKDGGYRLEPDGIGLLERFRTYTVPEGSDSDHAAAESDQEATGG